MAELHVGLGARAYPIRIEKGLLARVGSDLRQRAVAKRYALVADSKVAGLYGAEVLDALQASNIQADLLSFPEGEASKHLGTIADLASRIARLGLDRKDGLIALGGGVTGDITGFLAACYMRGIPFVQVPTTLLAQVDSSVGGKTGVDIPEGKNLVGAFYQPRAVYIDSNVLLTLPQSELLNGLAEVIKYAVIYDRNLFSFLSQHRSEILGLDLPVLEEVIRVCCSIKAQVVAADEKEADLRRILNFGHTIGHAIEAASDFRLAHGSAVAMGMVAASEIAVGKGILSRQEADQIRALIADFGLATTIPAQYDRQRIKAYLKTDKKAVAGRPFFVLPTTIGKVVITDEVDVTQIDRVL
jgi:3-dehydroquinate synthase